MSYEKERFKALREFTEAYLPKQPTSNSSQPALASNLGQEVPAQPLSVSQPFPPPPSRPPPPPPPLRLPPPPPTSPTSPRRLPPRTLRGNTPNVPFRNSESPPPPLPTEVSRAQRPEHSFSTDQQSSSSLQPVNFSKPLSPGRPSDQSSQLPIEDRRQLVPRGKSPDDLYNSSPTLVNRRQRRPRPSIPRGPSLDEAFKFPLHQENRRQPSTPRGSSTSQQSNDSPSPSNPRPRPISPKKSKARKFFNLFRSKVIPRGRSTSHRPSRPSKASKAQSATIPKGRSTSHQPSPLGDFFNLSQAMNHRAFNPVPPSNARTPANMRGKPTSHQSRAEAPPLQEAMLTKGSNNTSRRFSNVQLEVHLSRILTDRSSHDLAPGPTVLGSTRNGAYHRRRTDGLFAPAQLHSTPTVAGFGFTASVSVNDLSKPARDPLRLLPRRSDGPSRITTPTSQTERARNAPSPIMPTEQRYKENVFPQPPRLLGQISPTQTTAIADSTRSIRKSKTMGLLSNPFSRSNEADSSRQDPSTSTQSAEPVVSPSETPSPLVVFTTNTLHVETAQGNSYWSGRFRAHLDRFKSEFMQATLNDSVMMNKVATVTKSSKAKLVKVKGVGSVPEDENADENTCADFFEEDNEVTICRVFMHLEHLCVTDEAKSSLWEWQQHYARVHQNPRFLPFGGKMTEQVEEKENWVNRLGRVVTNSAADLNLGRITGLGFGRRKQSTMGMANEFSKKDDPSGNSKKGGPSGDSKKGGPSGKSK